MIFLAKELLDKVVKKYFENSLQVVPGQRLVTTLYYHFSITPNFQFILAMNHFLFLLKDTLIANF